MSKDLSPSAKKQLAARVSYYREMGIYDFYRRPSDEGVQIPLAAAPEPAHEVTDASPLPVIQDKPSASKEIREDIGDCTRCRLHKVRKNIVFGLGNINAALLVDDDGP